MNSVRARIQKGEAGSVNSMDHLHRKERLQKIMASELMTLLTIMQ